MTPDQIQQLLLVAFDLSHADFPSDDWDPDVTRCYYDPTEQHLLSALELLGFPAWITLDEYDGGEILYSEPGRMLVLRPE